MEETFTSEKPHVSHFVFLVVDFIFMLLMKRLSLLFEPSSIKGTFLGYNENPRGYTVYIPSQ